MISNFRFQISNFKFQIIAVLTALVFTACEGNDPIPASFPKKHLIEEFTGQACGYCPYGMDCIRDFMANDPNWVLILHHDGFSRDRFTVQESSTITKALGVSGAPSMCINRAKTKSDNGTKILFHPGYLPSVKKTQFDSETYASIVIENSYDAASRNLDIRIKGAVCSKDVPELMLTVLVKESGMIDTQKDYYKTYEGWQEFRHANAVREFLTEAEGDPVEIKNQRYSATYSLTLDNKWVPENCMVVAFLSESFKPVVQAEQCPVVAGTKGGADIVHGGIKAVPVPDYYPEPNATDGPGAFSGNQTETITAAYAWYTQYQEFTYWQIQAYNTGSFVTVNNTKCIPFTFFYVFTDPDSTTLPAGTYPFATTYQPGTAYAGYRNDDKIDIGGSMFYFTGYSYFQQGYLDSQAQWLITDGELVITDNGWSITGHTRNGADIKLEGTSKIINNGKASSPAKMPKIDARTCVNEKKAVSLHEILRKRLFE